jgi:PAS domain-containing protein
MVSPEHQSESKQVLGDTELRASLEQVGRVTDSSSEDSFRLIVETIPGLVAVMTSQGEVAHVNRRVLDYFGRTLEELKIWGTSDAVHPVDLPGVVVAWQLAVEIFAVRSRASPPSGRW